MTTETFLLSTLELLLIDTIIYIVCLSKRRLSIINVTLKHFVIEDKERLDFTHTALYTVYNTNIASYRTDSSV